MNAALRRCLAAIFVCTVLLISSRLAKADELKNDAIYAGVAIGAVAAAITVAIVLVVTHKPSHHWLRDTAGGRRSSQERG